MGLFSRPKADTEDHVPKADEDADTREIRVTVFPTGGGQPYIRDVEVDGKGTFELEPDSGKKYKVARGSVWQEGTVERAIVHEEVTMTVNPHQLDEDHPSSMSPSKLHGIAENNLWEQLDEIAGRKGTWQQKSTWAMIGLALLFGILFFWQIKTIGDGFDALAEALRSAQFAAENAGHQDISPE